MNVLLTLREYKKFTETEQHIRNYILKNDRKIPNMSIYELAEATYTSTASITRFCHKIGMGSFKDLKIKVVSELNAFDKSSINLLDSVEIKANDTPNVVSDKITKMTLQAIEETKMLLNEMDLLNVASIIYNCEQLDFYGVGESAVVAQDAFLKFFRIKNNVFYNSAETAQRIHAINSNDKHVAIVISYTGETAFIVNLIKTLKENNVKVISITGNTRNSVVNYADYALFVSSSESTYRTGTITSRTTSLFMVDIIYNACIAMNYNECIDRISRTRVPQPHDKK